MRRRRALGIAWANKGSVKNTQEQLDALAKSLADARQERVAAADKAEKDAKAAKKSESEIVTAIGSAMRGFSNRMEVTSAAIAEINATRALLENNLPEAKSQIALASDIPSERLSRMRFVLGETEPALTLARDVVKVDDHKVQPLANLADLLWRAGKQDEARETFNKLRALSAQLDLDVPAFARLAPIAATLQLNSDWRVTQATSADSGKRPELSSLGPFRWHPSPAPAFTLAENHWSKISLADYRGRPLVILFYLGKGCSHCIEQLNIFGPMVKAYQEAGIAVLAVSTDSLEGLHWTFEKAAEPTGFTFPIVSDASLATFKAFHAFDDFEQIPLHGTFLIDAQGLVRWQDIGHEPFRDPKWLLEESKRLLSVPVPAPEKLTTAGPKPAAS